MMISPDTMTKQLELLNNPRIGVELIDGTKVFGLVDKFSNYHIYIKDGRGDILDVPKNIIKRAFLLIKGGKDKEDV